MLQLHSDRYSYHLKYLFSDILLHQKYNNNIERSFRVHFKHHPYISHRIAQCPSEGNQRQYEKITREKTTTGIAA